MRSSPRVLVVGAGASGAECTRWLESSGVQVTWVDKGRRAGGRLATRRTSRSSAGKEVSFQFDHGAPAFQAKSPAIAARLDEWNHWGALAGWEPTRRDGDEWKEGPGLLTGLPTMSSLTTSLVRTPLEVSTRVDSLERNHHGWWASVERWPREVERLGPFDAVVVSAPAPQTRTLLSDVAPFDEVLSRVAMDPVWTVLVGLGRRSPSYAGYWTRPQEPWALLVDNDSKPGRGDAPDHQSWVGHATCAWSLEHLERDRSWVLETLLPSMLELLQLSPADVLEADAHRWRHGRVRDPAGRPSLWDAERRVGACGDWCLGDGVEEALKSGRDVARRLLASFAA